jgi:hypothetical protein
MGSKNSEIDGHMPKYISDDDGHTWKAEKTPFSPLGSNQRSTIIRLQDGKLFFAADLQRKDDYQPQNMQKYGKGAFVALSDDEGQTWHIKKLPGVQMHETRDYPTIGYTVVRQGPNGIIHLLTSMNRPNLSFAFNEAWIMQPGHKLLKAGDSTLMSERAQSVSRVKEYTQKYPNGAVKQKWSAGIADNGRYLLDGKGTWYYKNGQKEYEANFKMGKKTGEEKYWSPEGNLIWSWQHRKNKPNVWTHWWPNGQKKTTSLWKNFKAVGTATMWNRKGKMVRQVSYKHGMPQEKGSKGLY